MLGMAVVMTTFAGLAITLVIRRERGMLKRVRGTPLPPLVYLGALVTSTAVVLALEGLVVLLLGDVAFDVPLPENWWEIVLLMVLGAACFAGIGIAVTRFVPNAEGSSAVVNAIYLPVLLLSGAFFPVDDLPASCSGSPRRCRSPTCSTRCAPCSPTAASARRPGVACWSWSLWGVGGAVVALRTFRWEPRGG